MLTVDHIPPRCPRCEAKLGLCEKDTSSGDEVYTYFCGEHCGWLDSYIGPISKRHLRHLRRNTLS